MTDVAVIARGNKPDPLSHMARVSGYKKHGLFYGMPCFLDRLCIYYKS